MASREQNVTNVPTELAGISVGQTYFVQNTRGRRSILRVAVKPTGTNVDAAVAGFVLLFANGQPVSVLAGESVYVWHDPEDGDFYCAYDSTA